MTEVVRRKSDVVVDQGREQACDILGFDQGQVSAISTTADAAPRDATSARARVDDLRERTSAAIEQNVSPTGGSEGRHVVAARGDEHSVEPTGGQHVEHVLEEPPSEDGTVLVTEDGAKSRLALREGLGRHDGPGGPVHRTTSAQNARISCANRRRSSRERMIVEVPSTGMVCTVVSSPRSTTIARISPP